MDTFLKFQQNTVWLNEQKIAISALLEQNELLEQEEILQLFDTGCGIRTENPALINLCSSLGFPKDRLFFCCHSALDEEIDSLWDKCCFAVSEKDDIKKLDLLAPKHLKPGYLETIAITLVSDSDDEKCICESNMEQVAKWIRFSKSLAVRGIFVDCHAKENPAQSARDKFSLIIKIRSDMPCLFSYFCFDGLLDAVKNDPELLKTLTMLSALNDTSFYARFFIS